MADRDYDYGTWTDVHLVALPDGRIQADTETNDNFDRGEPGDIEEWTITYPSLADVPPSHRYTHTGLYGQPVRVWLNGVEMLADPLAPK
jgi:hypothetical protein